MEVHEDPFAVPESKLWHYVRLFGLLFWNAILFSPIAKNLNEITLALACHLPHFVAIGDILGVDDRIEVEPDHFFLVLRCRILILLLLPHQFGVERALPIFQNQVRAGKVRLAIQYLEIPVVELLHEFAAGLRFTLRGLGCLCLQRAGDGNNQKDRRTEYGPDGLHWFSLKRF